MEVLGRESAAQLLLELCRALRAWSFYREDPERLRHALERCGRVWASALAAGARLEVALREGRLALPGGESLADPTLGDLAERLSSLGIENLLALPGLEPDEIPLLVGRLAETRTRIPVGRLQSDLHERGARHVWLDAAPRSPAGRARLDTDLHSGARRLAELTVGLLEALESLETAEASAAYQEAGDRVEACVDQLLREHGPADAYRAVLALGRHATDPERVGGELQQEARARLRRLMSRAPLLEYTLAQACERSGLAQVHAAQVLLSVGMLASLPLVERCTSAEPTSTSQTVKILLAMGELALDPLLDQLSAGDREHARRAAILLGDLQHPRAIASLAVALRGSDRGLREEAARALARIGTTAAVHALAEAVGAGEAPARAAVASLSGSRHPLAVRALCELASGRQRAPEALILDAIRALGQSRNGGAVPTLCSILGRRKLLGGAQERIRRVEAARALGRIGGPVARRTLETHAQRGELSEACQSALRELDHPVSTAR